VLKLLLFFQLGFVVYQRHFEWLQTGIPAVAPINLIFVLALVLLRQTPDSVDTGQPALLRPLLWFYGALAFAFLWAQVLSFGDLVDDLIYFKTALFFPLYYLLYLRCRQDERSTRQLIMWIMVICAVAGLQAIRQGFDYGFGAYNPTHRASGPFSVDWRQSNRAGVYFGIFMPVFVAIALFSKGKLFWRVAAVAGMVLVAGGAIFTYSRQAYILILLSLGVLLVRKSLIVAIAVSAVLVAASGYLPDTVFQRVEETRQSSAGSSGEQEFEVSTASRWEIWAGALEMWREHPLGVGLNRFKRHIGNYSKHKGMDAHNFYVLTFAEAGPQGLLTYLLFIWSLFRLAAFLRRNAGGDPEAFALATGFTVSTVCVVLGQLYGSPIFEGSVMGCYWALCGLLERYVKMRMKAEIAPTTKTPSLADRYPLAAHLGTTPS
jgi:hypothetical protein